MPPPKVGMTMSRDRKYEVSMSSTTQPLARRRSSAVGTSGSFLKPKCSVTCQQSLPSASMSQRSALAIHGTSW